MNFAEQDAQSLGAKLEAMELSPGERAALDAVFETSGDDEVVGFAQNRARPGAYQQVLLGLSGGDIGIPRFEGGDAGKSQNAIGLGHEHQNP